jgi:phosphoribosylanthranilate isomerase
MPFDFGLVLIERGAMAQTIKICGLSTPATLEAALSAGADMVGFVFFPRSPRHVELDAARGLADRSRLRAEVVALCVDANDAMLEGIVEAVRPDYLQLHGSETPERVQEIQQRFGVSAIKAIGVATIEDFAKAEAYRTKADALLIDAKPPNDAIRPGGNGVSFNWRLAANFRPRRPWLLSGGLDATNVGEAISFSGARAVDVSSGVENAPGVKDPERIKAFIDAALEAFERQDQEFIRSGQ